MEEDSLTSIKMKTEKQTKQLWPLPMNTARAGLIPWACWEIVWACWEIVLLLPLNTARIVVLPLSLSLLTNCLESTYEHCTSSFIELLDFLIFFFFWIYVWTLLEQFGLLLWACWKIVWNLPINTARIVVRPLSLSLLRNCLASTYEHCTSSLASFLEPVEKLFGLYLRTLHEQLLGLFPWACWEIVWPLPISTEQLLALLWEGGWGVRQQGPLRRQAAMMKRTCTVF